MTCIDCDVGVRNAAPAWRDFFRRLSAYPKAYWGERVRRARLSRDIRRLREMSDHHLDDIGLRRDDVGERFDDLGAVRPDLVAFLSR